MRLHIDEEVQGSNEEINSPEEMKKRLETLIDEDVLEVSIKKRAAKDNSHYAGNPATTKKQAHQFQKQIQEDIQILQKDVAIIKEALMHMGLSKNLFHNQDSQKQF